MSTRLSGRDLIETAAVRAGFGRHDYKVTPGLYCMGNPTSESPVIVTANYKLTFDAVRKEMKGIDAWLLLADTRGINVWCAAGKALFSTEEIIHSVQKAKLNTLVSHRTLILPQLGATGVAAHDVKKGCGFEVTYGPVRATDLPRFITAGNKADEAMRTVTFTLKERAELIPVELFALVKPLLVILAVALLVSGIGPDTYSLKAAWTRGMSVMSATIAGILAGCVAVPLLLPILPWRAFAAKGALVGAVASIATPVLFASYVPLEDGLALALWSTALASYTGMLFTGCTPFTSPSGVSVEMRRAIPIQATAALAATSLWLTAPFLK